MAHWYQEVFGCSQFYTIDARHQVIPVDEQFDYKAARQNMPRSQWVVGNDLLESGHTVTTIFLFQNYSLAPANERPMVFESTWVENGSPCHRLYATWQEARQEHIAICCRLEQAAGKRPDNQTIAPVSLSRGQRPAMRLKSALFNR